MVHPGSSKLGLAMESLEELLCKVMSYFLNYQLAIFYVSFVL